MQHEFMVFKVAILGSLIYKLGYSDAINSLLISPAGFIKNVGFIWIFV